MSGKAVGEEANSSIMLAHGTPGLIAGSAPASGVTRQLTTASAAMPADLTVGRSNFGDNASPSLLTLIRQQDRIGSAGQNKAAGFPL